MSPNFSQKPFLPSRNFVKTAVGGVLAGNVSPSALDLVQLTFNQPSTSRQFNQQINKQLQKSSTVTRSNLAHSIQPREAASFLSNLIFNDPLCPFGAKKTFGYTISPSFADNRCVEIAARNLWVAVNRFLDPVRGGHDELKLRFLPKWTGLAVTFRSFIWKRLAFYC